MKRSQISSTFLGTVFLSFIFLTSSICAGQPSPQELFIYKNYGELKPTSNGGCNPANSGDAKWGKTSRCSIVYEVEEITTQIIPRNVVSIRIYKTNDLAESEVVRFITKQISKPNSSHAISEYEGKEINITRNSKGIKGASWVSGNKIISISSSDTIVSDLIINDYRSKYPPTFAVKSQDLDIQKIMKGEIEKKFSVIDEIEDKRKGIIAENQKLVEYELVASQCNEEMYIQCLYGNLRPDGFVDCPVSKTLDDTSRGKKWDALKKKVGKENVPVENINWRYINERKCRSPRTIEEDLMKLLGVDIQKLLEE